MLRHHVESNPKEAPAMSLGAIVGHKRRPSRQGASALWAGPVITMDR